MQCAVSDEQRRLAACVMQASKGALCARAMLALATHPSLLGTRGKATQAGTAVREALPDSWIDTPGYQTAAPNMAVFTQMMMQVLTTTNDKVVVFSDEIEPLRCYMGALRSTSIKSNLLDWRSCELTGGIVSVSRDNYVREFNDPKSSLRVAVVSTKSGGVGITLTGANRAIIIYPSHNPMYDYQALGRIHRPPQEKECFHYVLVSEGCADELVVLRQMMKSSVERCIFDTNASPIDFDLDTTLCREPRAADEADSHGALQAVLQSEPVTVGRSATP